ncbi:phosphodiesterase [Saccharopolyspora sp. NPDC002686]|uniref:phosphodiesterase n=1 Tax=Saccharopolyspora sp. NPDC002686 TaxID=3154541 RepID=UPI003330A3ED
MSLPRHTIIQISDSHIVPEGDLLHGRVDTAENLTSALEDVEKLSTPPDAVLLSGDLADTADPAAYRRLRAIVEAFGERTGIPVLYAMGNHDERAAFRAGLLDADGVEPYDHVRMFGDLRLIVLDSTVPGKHHGELTEEQLSWLADELATPAPGGTVLALHHPPMDSPIPLMDSVAFHGTAQLGEVLRGSDVRIVVSGHAHYPSAGLLGGVPVWISGASAYTQDVLIEQNGLRGVVGGAYTRIDVFEETAIATSVPIGARETVYEITIEQLKSYMEQES